MVTLSDGALADFSRFSLYNSPYVAHDEGCAIDLYPASESARAPDGGAERSGERERTGDARAAADASRAASRVTRAPSPVDGEVVETRTVDAPPKPYAVEHDHLVVVDTGEHLARILHVDPAVEPGDEVAVGDPLGDLVRSGFFAPWVGNHVHLGFRERDADPLRASGSLPVSVDVAVDPVPWDGSGRVVQQGETYVVLDAPDHPAPGERFAGIEAGDGVVLDGGFPHYEGGGALRVRRTHPGESDGDGSSRNGAVEDGATSDEAASGRADEVPVSLAGQRVGVAHGRTVAWDDVEVRANGTPITGVSLFVSRDEFGAKLVCPGHDFSTGERVEVTVG